MDAFEVMCTLRAMRRLKPDPIPDDVIRTILDAAVCAPSGGNRQTWSFLLIRDAVLRARMAELYRDAFSQELMRMPYYRRAAEAPPDSPEAKVIASARHLAEHMAEVPVLILACLDTGGAATFDSGSSIYPAVQNILLAARALGIGSTLTTLHRYREAQVKALLGIPEPIETAALIPLGYPQGRFGRPPRRAVSEVTFLDRWGSRLSP